MNFDSKQINYTSERSDLVVLIEKIKQQQINFFSNQKNNSLQKNISKLSHLIESILVDFPLPTFYLHELKDSSLYPIDNYGYEMLFALKTFVLDRNFKLQNLKYLSYLNEYNFDELPPERQRKIYWKEIRIYYINKWTPDFIKFDIYKNFSIGGIKIDIPQFDSAKLFLKKFERQRLLLNMPEKIFLRFVALYFGKYDNSDVDIFTLKEIVSNENLRNDIFLVESMIEDKQMTILEIWQVLQIANDDWKLCILVHCLDLEDTLQKAKELSIHIRTLASHNKYTFDKKFKTVAKKLKI